MNNINEQLVAKKKNRKRAIRLLVSEEVYTDREEHLEYLYHAAIDAIGRRTMSTVLLGQHRMGKTVIFKRVVNRLFFDQDHRDPKAVVPVYYSFKDEPLDRWEFAIEYTENFLRWYAAFRLREPSPVHELGCWFKKIDDPILLEFVGLRRLPNIVNEKEVEESGRGKV